MKKYFSSATILYTIQDLIIRMTDTNKNNETSNPVIFIKPDDKNGNLNAFPMIGGPQRIDSRKKAPLEPGYSPLDWGKLKSSGVDLRQGITQLQRYTEKEVLKHNSFDDMWMAYQGKVYNVTPYIPFHPGGKAQLLRGAGKDCTGLIQKIHPWINVDYMLDKCFIGYYVKE